MSPQSQRIAIAEACGWSVLSLSYGFYAKHKTEGRISISAASVRATCDEAMDDRAPDYLNSLDAMHEAEKVLEIHQQSEYGERLAELVPYEATSVHRDVFKMAHATAAQRAEAFLRTFGKWEEGK